MPPQGWAMPSSTVDDGMQCEIVFYDERPISVELPTTVVREISYTEPAVCGDS